MTIHVRKCPGCEEERSQEEVLCGNCTWDLTQEPLILPGQTDIIKELTLASPDIRLCLNGHLLENGDELCFVPLCGADALEIEPIEEVLKSNDMVIDGWSAIERLESHNEIFETFIVERNGHQALLTFYYPDSHPDLLTYEILKRLPKGYTPELLGYGEWKNRRYEITELISNPNLLIFLSAHIDLEIIRNIVKSVGKILDALSEHGLRHRNLRPENIFITRKDPLSILISGFQYSHLSTFDLDTGIQPISIRYTAPEIIAGGISAASDWWSLGMMVLQLITNGQYFDGINETAFRINIVTRGASLPKGVDPSLNLLLRGLLAQDPDQRWQWFQIKNWLAGEAVEAPSEINAEETQSGPAIEFNEHLFVCPKAFAIVAAEEINWEPAKDLLLRGVIATWLEECKTDPKIIAGIRVAASLDSIPDDFRLALALMWLNSNLPLIYKGEIVTSSWLLQNSIQGYELITSPLIGQLRQMKRELHLCQLHDRIEKAQQRAKTLEIELNEESFKLLTLVTSRQNLERQWKIHHRLYPSSDHAGLNSLMDRKKITDEELIIMLGAALNQYQSAEQILIEANNLASRIGLTSYDSNEAQHWFNISRRDIYREIEERTANYSRCGIQRVDEWASDFIIQSRISLSRALVLLSISKESWKEPDRRQYVSRILEFFEKRTVSLAQRGPLVRMLISKSGSRVDLAVISGNKSTPSNILTHLINRNEVPITIDRIAFDNNLELEKKLRHLVSYAKNYRRDTGIDSLYLGYPFLIMRESYTDGPEKKSKIVPILLWPIQIDIENREKATIIFDRARDEVRLNPALSGLMDVESVKIWAEVAKELLGRVSIRANDVMDAFGALAEPRERELCELPNGDYKIKVDNKQVVCSAVFFHAAFMGQAIGEDLRQMRKETPYGTSLETVLQVEPMISPELQLISERDRYFTMESDPSQEEAVFRARQMPGLLIEGPPGTGKSQTIVNIIGDCVGRKETVLVVCQKAAALEILAKKLDSEGLKDRYFYITHVNKERASVLESIRIQIDGIPTLRRNSSSENIERERNELAEKIENLENEIDKHHKSNHEIDMATGLSYRNLLGQLINLEDVGVKLIDAPSLRRELSNLDLKQLSEIEEICSPLAGIWLKSSFEGSSLVCLKKFSPDSALINEFITTLLTFIEVEKYRDNINIQSIVSFDVENPLPHQEWISTHDMLLKNVDWKKMSSWFHLFTLNGQSKVIEILTQLQVIQQTLRSLDLNNYDSRLSGKLIDLPKSMLTKWLHLAKRATAPKSFFNRINPINYIKYLRIQKILAKQEEPVSRLRISQLQNAADLELHLRPIREVLVKLLDTLYGERDGGPLFLTELILITERIIEDLSLAKNGIHALYACPRQAEIQPTIDGGLRAYQDLVARYELAFNRYQARFNSLTVLDKLSLFFNEDLFNTYLNNIQKNQTNLAKLQPIVEALPSLSDYQEFRLQSSDFSPKILKIFAILREKDKDLRNYPIEELESVIRRIIAREARLGWKERIEEKFPILRLAQKELSRKIQILDESITRIRELNQKLLAFNIDIEKIRSSTEWTNITRLRGPRACRLREFVEQGYDLGLMQIRPIWLMNPDTASQLLPLRAGMFDTVIFDEASQIPIENALPALYRAKRVIISGDEKQMPPNSNFRIHLTDDEEETVEDDPDEIISETELRLREDTFKRQEIKDCSDLLALGKIVLPRSMLKIHYRSKYRELISFSNAAFYNNQLSVPVRHPESVVQSFKPIQMIRVDGIYSNRTNRKEAEKIVAFLAKVWVSDDRPSIGVVTFNAPQMELIDDVLEERAENDHDFRKALARERERQQEGEDMSFFVKNVENVQGDEREMIIFSSTFGRNEDGVFKKNFGPLGKPGGERRLNVAITRARKKILLFTSLPINEISDALLKPLPPKSPRDFLQAYFDYASKISDGSIEIADRALDRIYFENPKSQISTNHNKDGFIRSVAEFIISLGLKPIQVKEQDAFGLDFVIEDPNKKRFGIGIECDAPCHQILVTARAREIWRPKVLRMGIPYVHRVTSYAWYHRRQDEREHLKQVLEEALGIMFAGRSTTVDLEG
ncbi:MAG: protein kinase [Tatlockia sp.]|nr:protein kinase [Tatlockia sp.]